MRSLTNVKCFMQFDPYAFGSRLGTTEGAAPSVVPLGQNRSAIALAVHIFIVDSVCPYFS